MAPPPPPDTEIAWLQPYPDWLLEPVAPGDAEYRPLSLDVLRIEAGTVVEVSSFVGADMFPAFGLPQAL